MEETAQPRTSQALFAQNLRAVRRLRGLSQQELAERAELSTSYISELETGRKWVSSHVLDALCKALSVQAYHLFIPTGNGAEVDGLGFAGSFADAVRERMNDVFGMAFDDALTTLDAPE